MQNHDLSASVDDDAVTAITFAAGFRTEVVAAGHALIADEPAAVGGTNEGPSPYDLLSAALASCTSMTLKMYARHKKIELRSVKVRVQHGRVHSKDCSDCESSRGMIDVFERELWIDGDLSEKQRQRMLEIADRCPVHKTLHNEIKVRTVLAD
jgi:putative redox protein